LLTDRPVGHIVSVSTQDQLGVLAGEQLTQLAVVEARTDAGAAISCRACMDCEHGCAVGQ
jgi:hypothetical protein